jgi:hypothetical protein
MNHFAIVRSLLLVPYQRERKKVRGSTQPALLIISYIGIFRRGRGCKVIYTMHFLLYEEGFGHN